MRTATIRTRRFIVVALSACLACSLCLVGCSGTGTSSSTKPKSSSSSASVSSSVSSSTSSSSEPPASSASSQVAPASGGVTPSFKEAMDEYESFINGYCDFMRKYIDSGYSANMMNDYLKWMNQYSSVMAKIEAIDSNNLSGADSAYYIEVVGRANQRLASIL